MSILGIKDSGQKIVTSGLVLNLDAAQLRSYSGSGTTWTDLSGNGNNGTLNNASFLSDNGGIIDFDGTDDYVAIGSPSSMNTSAGCIDIWVKLDDPNRTSQQQLFARANQSNGSFNILVNYFNSRTYLQCVSRNTDNLQEFTNTDDAVDANWNNYCFSYDTALGYRSYYKNGTLQIEWSITKALNTSTTIFDIKLMRQNSFAASFGDGKFAIARYYNRGLTATEIVQNYNATKLRFGL